MLKVVFELDPGDWHGASTESMWAEMVWDRSPPQVILMNSPFHVEGVSFLDTVFVRMERLEKGERFWFAGVAARGGHSTYFVLTEIECPDFPKYWSRLEALGCSYEETDGHTSYGHRMIYAVDVPPETGIHAVYAILAEGERDKVWRFQAGNLEHTW
ncbi:MAG TPA: DUF4265 domain-containing protein [Stellaceae bacterium]|nr:DUF4265 domain-containing protein [Stellaceae bacterium]